MKALLWDEKIKRKTKINLTRFTDQMNVNDRGGGFTKNVFWMVPANTIYPERTHGGI